MDTTKQSEPQEMLQMVRSIGSALRQLRKERKLSLDELADRTGVSKLTLGKIERGESNPSLCVIWRMTDGLGVPLSSLFAEESGVLVSRSGEGIQLTDGPWKIEPMFAESANGTVEIYRAYLDPHSEYSSEYHPTGLTETVTVLSGSVRVIVCDKPYELKAFDAVRFRGDHKHSYNNDTDEVAVLQISLERQP
ncbi:helix-turn-helix domain-containing protein [Paenibacillus sp. NPDC056579]|uniref:helix-turn-helix domain-containing protein n=1 Tax=Paenibacillus sp. NPDC056579 TaxID=3345871 RepID=UPI0036CFC9E1